MTLSQLAAPQSADRQIYDPAQKTTEKREFSVKPIKSEALGFLSALDPDAGAFTFQTFDDDYDRKDPHLALVRHGTLDQHWDRLCELSARGAGVFVTINETDLNGRCTNNITRVRALFVDTDGADHAQILKADPHLVVETSQGNFHDYWFISNCPMNEFTPAQKVMIGAWETDKSVHDLPRVMRLPGFPHQKVNALKGLTGEPFMVRIVHDVSFLGADSWEHRKEEIAKLAQTISPQSLSQKSLPTMREGSVAISINNASQPSEAEARDLLSYIDPDLEYSDWLKILQAMHDVGDHFLPLAVNWSAGGRKFKVGEVEGKWHGFTRGRGVTWATIPDMARRNGANLSGIALNHKQGLSLEGMVRGNGVKIDLVMQQSEKPLSAFQFVSVADLKYRAPEYIVDELFEAETLGLIFGDPGCGKSFLAVDIALSVASGTPFHGRSVKQGSVFFIAGEGHNGLARRFKAWSMARDVGLDGVPLFKSERAAQFLDKASAVAVAEAVAILAEQHGKPALIIIDTLARNFGAGDENNTKDMSEFVVAIDDLKAKFPGSAVIIVHHSGHASKERARGAMALKGALDTEYRVEKEGAAMKLVNTKMKDAEPPQDLFFTFEQVDLDDVTKSAVLEASDAPATKHRLTPNQRLGLETYQTAALVLELGDEKPFVGVHVDQWREEFYAKHTGDTHDSKKKAFQRVRKDLTDLGELLVQNDVYMTSDIGMKMGISFRRDSRDKAGHSEICHGAEAGNAGTDGTNA